MHRVADRGLLRIEEAAQWLGIGRTKAFGLVFHGTLSRVKIGRSRRIAVSAFEAFVENLVERGETPDLGCAANQGDLPSAGLFGYRQPARALSVNRWHALRL